MKKRVLFPIALAIASFMSTQTFAIDKICTSREMLYSAIQSAKDNETIYVGDIDFTPDGNVFNSVMRLDLSKSITLKNGKKNGEAVFKNGSFNIKGGKIPGSLLEVSFEGITFDGAIDGKALTDDSWEYEDPMDLEPRMSQYAMRFMGNVDAKYKDCSFKNYMYEYGAAFWARYGDYTGELEEWFGNYSTCSLSIALEDCSIFDNYSMYGGGAFYFEGNSKNIFLDVKDSEFIGNKTGCTQFSEGGGAFRLQEVEASFKNCLFDGNEGSYSYGSTPRTGQDPEYYEWYLDPTHGGAIASSNSKVNIENCMFTKNKACNGGALFLGMSDASIDGCVFDGNIANCKLLEESTKDKGPWSNMGMGGAIYIDSQSMIPVDIWNTSFYQNQARNAYGSVYGYYNGDASELQPDVFPKVRIFFSSFYQNKVEMTYDGTSQYKWAEEPGDVFEIPYFDMVGCFIEDDTYASYFKRHELPTMENKYCYYGSLENVKEDLINVSIDEKSKQIVLMDTKHSLDISKEFAKKLLDERYTGISLKEYKIGSNYSYSYYNKDTNSNDFHPIYVVLSICGVVLVLLLTILVVFLKKRKKASDLPKENTIESIEEPMVSFEQTEVDSMLQDTDLSMLTNREKDILKGILKGKKRKEIAEEFFVSEATIKKYTTSLYKKMGVSTRLELFAKMNKGKK